MKIKEKPTALKLIAAVLSLLMISSVLPYFAVTASAAITPSTPQKDTDGVYQIGTAEELYGFAQLVNSKTEPSASAVLTKDIVVNTGVLKADGNLADDTSGFTSWTPIGNSSNQYTGKFDGQGHTISGLYFNNTSTSNVGLFGWIGSGGEIKNVGVIDSYFKGKYYVGDVCGLNEGGTITGCYNTGTVSGSSEVGGVCGLNDFGGTIAGCYNIGIVSGNNTVGGVCGFNIGAITGCYNTGTVSGNDGSWNVGGVCGRNGSSGAITGSYNTGTVSGSSEVGGVCGQNERGIIIGCYNTGTISGSDSVGGVCGRNDDGIIIGCYTNNKDICGLNNGTVKDCEIKSDAEFADGTVCTLLNTALNNYDVRFYQGANYPEPVANVPDLVEGVYQISNKLELYAFAKIVNRFEPSASAVLTADIVVNTGVLKDDGTLNSGTFTDWTPIGDYSKKYTGKFDGQGHTVSGLYFNDSSTNYVGLFGYLSSGGEIKNVGVIDSYFSGRESVGGVCGWNDGGTITGCYNTGAVSSSGYYVGGVCAVNKGGTIIGCYNTGTVSGVNGVGGVCAVNNSTITGCYNTGEVIGTTDVGGVCGFNSGTITGCYINKGGVCGNNFRGTVTDSDVKTDAEFANGTVCKLLNTALKNASSKVLFCQTIGTDALPLLDYQIEEHTPLYTVENKTFKVTCLCGKKSKTMELTLKTDKTVVVNGAENTLTATLSNLENEAVTYKWYQNGVEIPNETSATYQMPTDLAVGTYTYKVEVTMENVGTITQSVDVLVDITPQYYVNIPATVNIGDNFTVGASGVLLKNNAKLNVSLLSDFTLSTAKGASLNYEILTSNSKLTSGDTLLTVQGSQDPKAPGSGTSETYNVALALGETPTHSGNYTDTLTFTIKVEP
ncbi:MAG: GLUG motif-containing protein [Ruminococcus sp.]